MVAIHVSPLSSFYDNRAMMYVGCGISYYLARIAVPFYFVSAGFFLFRKINLNDFNHEIFKKYIFKNLRLLGLWSILLFVGSSGHLWYMGGLIVAVFFIEVLLYYKTSFKKMIILAFILYLIGLLGDSYYGVLTSWGRLIMNCYFRIFGTTRNGIFMGFPFMLLGGAVAKRRHCLKSSTSFTGMVLSMLAFLIEVVVLTKLKLPRDHNMYIFLIPVEFFLLSFTSSVKMKCKNICRSMRAVGIVVYFSHLFVLYWINLGVYILRRFVGVELVLNSLIEYFMTCVITLIIGFVVEKLSHRDRLGFLRYFYS